MTSSRPILMPKLGLTMTEGVLIEWKTAPGASVAAGNVIFVVETDKISSEIESAEAGVVEALLVAVGDTVPVGAPVAMLAVAGTAPSRLPAAECQAEDETGPLVSGSAAAGSGPLAGPRTQYQDSQGKRLISTPLARRIAAEAGVDLACVTGSGPRGRIMAVDLASAKRVEPASDPMPAPVPAQSPEQAGTLLPLGQYQKVAARRLTESKREIPHFYVFAEADVTALVALREGLNAGHGSPRLTVSHFLVAAMARALAAMPAMNRVWREHGVLQLEQVDIGLAIESPKGLVAPLLRDLSGAALDEIAVATGAMIDRARANRLSSTELEGGATSISNVGMFGATGLLPIINPGQASILGVGRSQGLFRPDAQGQPVLRQILGLALSCDHRVIDGALAARFLQAVQNHLEVPHALLRKPSPGDQA